MAEPVRKPKVPEPKIGPAAGKYWKEFNLHLNDKPRMGFDETGFRTAGNRVDHVLHSLRKHVDPDIKLTEFHRRETAHLLERISDGRIVLSPNGLIKRPDDVPLERDGRIPREVSLKRLVIRAHADDVDGQMFLDYINRHPFEFTHASYTRNPAARPDIDDAIHTELLIESLISDHKQPAERSRSYLKEQITRLKWDLANGRIQLSGDGLTSPGPDTKPMAPNDLFPELANHRFTAEISDFQGAYDRYHGPELPLHQTRFEDDEGVHFHNKSLAERLVVLYDWPPESRDELHQAIVKIKAALQTGRLRLTPEGLAEPSSKSKTLHPDDVDTYLLHRYLKKTREPAPTETKPGKNILPRTDQTVDRIMEEVIRLNRRFEEDYLFRFGAEKKTLEMIRRLNEGEMVFHENGLVELGRLPSAKRAKAQRETIEAAVEREDQPNQLVLQIARFITLKQLSTDEASLNGLIDAAKKTRKDWTGRDAAQAKKKARELIKKINTEELMVYNGQFLPPHKVPEDQRENARRKMFTDMVELRAKIMDSISRRKKR